MAQPAHAGGGARSGGRTAVRAVNAAAQADQQQRLFATIQIPDDTRVWAVVALEGDDARLTVRAGAADVIGEVSVDVPDTLAAALRKLVADHADDAKADLRHGIARTMAASVAGRSG